MLLVLDDIGYYHLYCFKGLFVKSRTLTFLLFQWYGVDTFVFYSWRYFFYVPGISGNLGRGSPHVGPFQVQVCINTE